MSEKCYYSYLLLLKMSFPVTPLIFDGGKWVVKILTHIGKSKEEVS